MRWRMPVSMTSRLAILFALVAVLTFSLVGWYLYRELALQLALRDEKELVGKIAQIRHLLGEVRSPEDIERSPHGFLNAVFGHDGLLFMIATMDGRALVQNAQWPEPIPPVEAVAATREPALTDVFVWKTELGPARLVVARGFVTRAGGAEVRIYLAKQSEVRGALLAQYRGVLMLASAVGTLMAALLGYAAVRHGLRPIGVIASKANEITSRRLDTRLQLEEAPSELRQLATAFNAMLDRLEDGIRRLTGFAADLAHDLRTPVHALRVKTEVALSRPRSADEYHTLLASNMEEYERLSRLIENTLFLARADNAQLAIHCESIDIREALNKIVDYFSGPAEEAGVTCTVHGGGTVWADPVLLHRAVSNLLSNGIRHTAPGGHIRVTASEDARDVSISVENRGTGIAAEHLERVFDRYFRGDPSRGADGSAGLGLAIVRVIMKLHGGSAEVTTENAGTTRFTLRFPRERHASGSV